MNKIKQSILAIVIGLVLSAGVSYAYSTWVGPTVNPPGNNTDTPINTGSGDQTKMGGLVIGDPLLGLDIKGASNFMGTAQFTASQPMIIASNASKGKVLTAEDSTGKVSWKSLRTVLVRNDIQASSGEQNQKFQLGKGAKATCGTGYVRTGCNASCRGKWNESDARPVDGEESCKVGDNDRCEGSDPDIYIYAICLRVWD